MTAQPERTKRSPQYEFSQRQNEPIEELARKMKFVGIFVIIFGVIACASIYLENYVGAVAGVVNIIIGIWTISAAGAFRSIVQTKGRDIRHLMDGLREFLKMYRLQFVLINIGLAMIIAAVVMEFMANMG